jgi:very-short-patch-repair endonuclease
MQIIKRDRKKLLELYARAKWMRDHPTEAELQAWIWLRKLQSKFIFRRQIVPYGTYYIVDFLCEQLNLAIEIDGEYHNSYKQRKKDEERKWMLNRWGIRVLPFQNDVVLQKPEFFFQQVKTVCEGLEERYYGKKKELPILIRESGIKRINRFKKEGQQNRRARLF